MYNNVSFYYVNINGLSKKRGGLSTITSEHNPHIFCLVKTKFSHNVKVNIPGYYIFKKGKNALSGGIIVAVKKEISSNCIKTTEIENNRILSFRIDTQSIVTTVISVYGQQENDLF